jgi:predicted ATPase
MWIVDIKTELMNMLYRPSNYVITGGCGSGKTVLIQHLGKSHKTIPERLREVGREMHKPGDPKFHIRDIAAFANEVLRRSLTDYLENDGEFCFFDRGIPDYLVVFPLHGRTPSDNLWRASTDLKYNVNVFLTEIFPDFHPERHPFPYDVCVHMQEELYAVYSRLGYNVVRIPTGTVERRAEMIWGSI